jgi:predicted dehydrogenase
VAGVERSEPLEKNGLGARYSFLASRPQPPNSCFYSRVTPKEAKSQVDTIRIGIVGLGGNTRLRHVPGLRACAGVKVVGVCNRSPESSQRAADEFDIPKSYDNWEQLVDDSEIDAVMIGTWPYVHCPITLAALDAGKHVLTEARMAMNAEEARKMLAASQANPKLVTQIVPSPLGLRAGTVVKELLADGFIGDLREVVVLGTNSAAADPDTPLHWRQSSEFSGINMLALGILHEPLTRWIPDPISVLAQTQTFTRDRPDPQTGELLEVGTPDSVQVLTQLLNGARCVYHLSGAIHFGPGMQIHLYGSEGTLKYKLAPEDKLFGGHDDEEALHEISVPDEKAGYWRVEEEFVNAIRGLESVKLNDFATGVRYMEFTEAVANSAQTKRAIELPLPPPRGQ